MIIKRKKNVEEFLLEEKNFAEINCKEDLISKGYFLLIPLEMIKTIEMYDARDGNDLIHWIIDMPYRSFNFAAKYNISPQMFFYGVLEDNLSELGRMMGKNNINQFTKSYNWSESNKFIEYILKILIYGDPSGNVTDPDRAKYASWFNSNSITYNSADYKMIFKFIALSLSGQLDPEVFDFWQDYPGLRDVKVNYGIIKYRSKSDIARVLVRCMEKIKYYIHPKLEKFI